jgi:hypothetical protein
MRFVVLALAVAACGPSFADIRTAHEATYAMDATRLMQVALMVADKLVGVAAVDIPNRTIVTKSFLTSDRMAHRGWPARCARGGWRLEVRTNEQGRSFVTITPLAQASRTVCHVRWDAPWTPSWVDVDPDAVGLRATLENGADKMALAIHERASR